MFGNAIVLNSTAGISLSGKKTTYEDIILSRDPSDIYDRINISEFMSYLSQSSLENLVAQRAALEEPFTNFWCVFRVYKNPINISTRIANGAKYIVIRVPMWKNREQNMYSFSSATLCPVIASKVVDGHKTDVFHGVGFVKDSDYIHVIKETSLKDLDVGASATATSDLIVCDLCYDIDRIAADFGATDIYLGWTYYKGTTNFVNKTQVFANAPVDYPELYFVYENE